MRTTGASLALLAMVLAGAAACGGGGRAPDADDASGGSSPPPVAASTPALTPPAEPIGSPASSPGLAPADALVMRMKWCVDTCASQEATVVMRDGRVAWNEPGVGLRQGRLSPAGVAWVEAQIEATGLLDRPGTYDAQLRPGAQPPGSGATSFSFTVTTPSGPVLVNAGIPGIADERYWIIPAELKALADLGGTMMIADDWVPADLWVEGPEPYVPQQYLLVVTLNPERPAAAIDPRAVVDVDRVAWPMPGAIDTLVPAAGRVNDPRARCAVLDAGMAERVDAAQRAEGLPGEPRPPFAERAYLWERGGGYLTVEFQPLMPDEHDCLPAQFSLD